jgi:hypothetical protein
MLAENKQKLLSLLTGDACPEFVEWGEGDGFI